MNVVLWILQGLLAFVFIVSGTQKALRSKRALIDSGQTGVVFFPTWAIRVIATCELVGAVALIVPGIVDRAEPLTPLAAIGFCLLMVGAAITHARLHEPRNIAINAALFTMSAIVAIGRL